MTGQRTMLKVQSYQCVSIQEHAFLELSQAPAVQFRKGDAELWSLEHGQVGCILRVQHIHLLDDIEDGLQFATHRFRYAGRDENGQLMDGLDTLQCMCHDQCAQGVRVICGQCYPSGFWKLINAK